MSEFKFNCPACGQHILADEEWVGRRINCPSCNTGIAVPPPAREGKKRAPGGPPTPAARPGAAGAATPVKLPATASVSERKPVAPAQPTEARGPARSTGDGASGTKAEEAPPSAEQPRVAALTPAVKLEMVRAVRQRLADESAWLPGKVKGAVAYAAKMEGGEVVVVDAKSPEATRFSLIGAFLKEMEILRVVRTATGRRRFLDEEIPEAVHEMQLEGMTEEQREKAGERPGSPELESLSHPQCLAVLEVLEERYLRRKEKLQIEKAKRSLGSMRLADVVKKLEKKVPVSPEEVATALYHELMEVHRRLERLESKNSSGR